MFHKNISAKYHPMERTRKFTFSYSILINVIGGYKTVFQYFCLPHLHLKNKLDFSYTGHLIPNMKKITTFKFIFKVSAKLKDGNGGGERDVKKTKVSCVHVPTTRNECICYELQTSTN